MHERERPSNKIKKVDKERKPTAKKEFKAPKGTLEALKEAAEFASSKKLHNYARK
jgi:hypothetical protein